MTQSEITWDELGRHHIARSSGVFLVAGKSSFTKSGAQEKLGRILGDTPHVRFSEFTENPNIREISAGVAAFRASDCDLILAIGGGSTMDVAKAIHLFAQYNEEEQIAILMGQKQLACNETAGRPLVVVPTTFGTGSESTHFAVVYMGARKFSLAHPSGLPTAYILDPLLALSAPPVVRAATGIDALCQAIEAYWAVGSTDESCYHAAKAISLIKDNLVSFVKMPNETVSKNMAYGANFAGRAINIAKTTAPHALSYAITKTYNVSHGQAVAFSLPFFFQTNIDKGSAETKKNMIELFVLLGVDSAKEASCWFRTLLKDIELKVSLLDQVGVSVREVRTLVDQVNVQRLKNHPVTLSQKDLLDALLFS